MKQQCKPNTFPDQRRLSVVWLWGDTVMVGRKSSNGQLEVNVLDSALSLNMANHHFLSLDVNISELKNLSWIKIKVFNNFFYMYIKKSFMRLPWWSSGCDSGFPLQWAQVQPLICRLRSYMLHVLVAQSCPTLCDPMDCSPPGSSVHGTFQARILEWFAISSSNILMLHDAAKKKFSLIY